MRYKGPTRRNRVVVPAGALADAAIIVGATLATTLFLLFISGQIQDTTSGNLTWSPARQTTTTARQPTPQPSPLAHPSPSASLATPTPVAPESGATDDIPDDAAIQAEIDKRIADDPNFSKLDITATVTNGKVILVGTVPTTELKTRIEKLVRAFKGVKDVDNQIVAGSGG
jgi:hypothetical protein